jgi:hypothetical protein
MAYERGREIGGDEFASRGEAHLGKGKEVC